MRPEANSTFVLTRGFEDCIILYPLDRWKEVEEEVSALNMYDRDARRFARIMMMWAEEVPLDAQGRVRLTEELKAFAAIDDKALIIGSFDKIEIWNPDVFENYLSEGPDDYQSLAERVMADPGPHS